MARVKNLSSIEFDKMFISLGAHAPRVQMLVAMQMVDMVQTPDHIINEVVMC